MLIVGSPSSILCHSQSPLRSLSAETRVGALMKRLTMLGEPDGPSGLSFPAGGIVGSGETSQHGAMSAQGRAMRSAGGCFYF